MGCGSPTNRITVKGLYTLAGKSVVQTSEQEVAKVIKSRAMMKCLSVRKEWKASTYQTNSSAHAHKENTMQAHK